MALSEQLVPVIAAALSTYGDTPPDGDAGAQADTAAGLGRWLLREIFGNRAQGEDMPAPLAALIADPGGSGARDALEMLVHDALYADPGLQAAAADALVGLYRGQIDAGNSQAMVDLGDLLRAEDDPEGARAAYQQAIDAGNTHAMIDMARLLHGDLGDAECARSWLQRAIGSGDPDVAAEALVNLGSVLLSQRDAEGARAAFQQAIESGHAEWAPAGMFALAHLLRRQGHADRARAAYLKVIDAHNTDWAPAALTELLNLLRDQNDIQGARAAHQKAIETGNPNAPYALIVIAQMLEEQGDTEGARAAYQQAAEAGYPFADEL